MLAVCVPNNLLSHHQVNNVTTTASHAITRTFITTTNTNSIHHDILALQLAQLV
jgi:hypothetical protein